MNTASVCVDSVAGSLGALTNSWVEVGPDDFLSWNDRLLLTSGALQQYPYWNEPFRMRRMRPRYLVWGTPRNWLAYVCILTIDIPAFRIGLVFRGPITLTTNQDSLAAALGGLYTWARESHYVFVRFTHANPEVLDAIGVAGLSERRDRFPLFEDMDDLVVDQTGTDEVVLAGFSREARRKLRRAKEAGFTVRCDDRPEELITDWPVFLATAKRRGFDFHRGIEHYLKLIEGARFHNCVRMYTVLLNSKPIAASVVVRDRDTAFCYMAGLDVESLGDHPSPTVLLHWEGMRDMHRQGVLYYNFGASLGKVGFFKEQFLPRKITYPPPVTLVVNLRLYRLWCATLSVVQYIWPSLKNVIWAVARLVSRIVPRSESPSETVARVKTSHLVATSRSLNNSTNG